MLTGSEAMMDTFLESSASSCDLSQIPGITPGFIGYLKSTLQGKILGTKFIKENAGKVTLCLTFNLEEVPEKGAKFSRHLHASSSKKTNSAANPQPISLPKKKRKSPSRRRRDRERFRRFIENKRQRALNSTQLSQSSSHSSNPSNITSTSSSVVGSPVSYQCSPSQDETISDSVAETVSVAEPPTVTLNLDLPSEPVLAEHPVSNPEPQPCKCDICTKIAASPDLSTALYLEFTFCLTAAREVEGGLWPCSRCLLHAYCSKECQSKDWKTHKKGPWRGVSVSGVDSKFSVMSAVDLAVRASSVGLSGVSSVGLAILSVGLGWHWFWFKCQCRLGEMSQCRVSEIPPS